MSKLTAKEILENSEYSEDIKAPADNSAGSKWLENIADQVETRPIQQGQSWNEYFAQTYHAVTPFRGETQNSVALDLGFENGTYLRELFTNLLPSILEKVDPRMGERYYMQKAETEMGPSTFIDEEEEIVFIVDKDDE